MSSTATSSSSSGQQLTELSLEEIEQFDKKPREALSERQIDTLTLSRTNLKDEPLPSADPPSLGRRASRSLPRFLITAFCGAAVTLAWQFYCSSAQQMIANWAAPRLGLSSALPPMSPPPTADVAPEQPSPPAVQAATPEAEPVQTATIAPTAPETADGAAPRLGSSPALPPMSPPPTADIVPEQPSPPAVQPVTPEAESIQTATIAPTASETADRAAPRLGWSSALPPMNPSSRVDIAPEQASPSAVHVATPEAEPVQTGTIAPSASALQTMARDLVAVRQNIEQLAAGQKQMARKVKQYVKQEIRHGISTQPGRLAVSRRKSARTQPALQSLVMPFPHAPPEPALRPPIPVGREVANDMVMRSPLERRHPVTVPAQKGGTHLGRATQDHSHESRPKPLG